MKKKICITTLLIFFAATLVFSVYSTSKDSIFNIVSGLNKVVFEYSDNLNVNQSESDGIYFSADDSMITFSNINTYVHNVMLKGVSDIEGDFIQVFITDDSNGAPNDEQSEFVPYNISGGNLFFYLDRNVSSLRIIITPAPDSELVFKGAVINDRSPVLSINKIALNCILPTALAALILFAALYYKSIGTYMASFRKFVPLLKNLISRDLKVKYRRSVLGFLWSILNPLLMALVFNIVFSRIFRFKVDYYATYYLTGSLIFNFVIESTSNSMTSILSAAPLIKKVYIPKYIFPLEKCVFAFINMLFSTFALAVIMVIQGVPFHMTVFLAFIPMTYAFIFAYGLGLMLSAFTVFFRDIEHLYSVMTTVWMYLTPIIYPEQALISSGLSIVLKANPMYYFIHSFRNTVMYGALPTMSDNVMCAAFALLFISGGLLIFKKLQDKFILYI